MNCRHQDFQSRALPTELPVRNMVEGDRVELPQPQTGGLQPPWLANASPAKNRITLSGSDRHLCLEHGAGFEPAWDFSSGFAIHRFRPLSQPCIKPFCRTLWRRHAMYLAGESGVEPASLSARIWNPLCSPMRSPIL